MKAKKTWKKQNDEGKRKWKLNGCRSTSSSEQTQKCVNDERCAFFWLFMLFGWFFSNVFTFYTLQACFFLLLCCVLLSLNDIKATCRKALLHFLILLYFNDKRWESSFGEYIRSCAIQMEWIRSDTQLCTESFFCFYYFWMKRMKDERGREDRLHWDQCEGKPDKWKKKRNLM